MSFPVSRAGRLGQSQYWINFGVYVVGSVVLLFGAISSLLSLDFLVGIACLLLLFPLSIYFRIVMMRRCRDIGWPAFLPWMLFVVQTLAGFMSGAGSLQNPVLLTVPMIVGLADFIFMIAIGCIAGKDERVDYDAIFGPEDGMPQRAQPAARMAAGGPMQRQPGASIPTAYDEQGGYPENERFDAAISRALESYRSGESPGQAAQPAGHPAQAAGRPAGGFGRKGL